MRKLLVTLTIETSDDDTAERIIATAGEWEDAIRTEAFRGLRNVYVTARVNRSEWIPDTP